MYRSGISFLITLTSCIQVKDEVRRDGVLGILVARVCVIECIDVCTGINTRSP